ncbi:MAG: selenide, water dikinase SelD [Pseudomonadota bacterium]
MRLSPNLPVLKDIVLIGGGHAHVTVLKRFGMKPVPGVRLTLISPDAHTPYSGMLPGLIAGHYTYDEAHIDLVRLCRFAGAIFISGAVEGVDAEQKTVRCAARPPIPYDVLSINAGSTPDPSVIPGAAGVVIPVKPVAEFLNTWAALQSDVRTTPDMQIGVIGAGAGGVELALSAQFALGAMLTERGEIRRPRFQILTRGSDILETHNPRVRSVFRKLLAERDIKLVTDFAVNRIEPGHAVAGDRSIQLDRMFWVTGAEAPDWLSASNLDTDERGFMRVDETLRSVSHPDVFGVGDCASIVGHSRPKSGVFAVRQGPPLERNLRNLVYGRTLQHYRPQKAFLSLVSTGDQNAVVSWGGLCLQGAWCWRLKDNIDRSFMTKFSVLPDMAVQTHPFPDIAVPDNVKAELSGADMRCGGCGAKVGSSTLSRVLDGLAMPNTLGHKGIEPGARDDAVILNTSGDQPIVQSIDMFRSMIDDPLVFGKIAANHSLNDVYAMGAHPKWALAIATVPFGLATKTETTLSDIMSGAVSVLDAAGCQLVGGHTAEGAELAMGFSVTGVLEDKAGLRKSGARPGEYLILTKPVGTGLIFAADMRGKAKGRWVQAAIASALVSNQNASSILRNYGATSCTDVTGFGLAGHLIEILDASGCSAQLELDAVPVLAGTPELIAAGIASSLYAENAKVIARIELGACANDVRIAVLFDPQTAGGLLASIPAENVLNCLEALKARGYVDARVVGRLVNPGTHDPVVELQPIASPPVPVTKRTFA